eukprot:13980558-Alexandrium_andersonii.AAC.1
MSRRGALWMRLSARRGPRRNSRGDLRYAGCVSAPRVPALLPSEPCAGLALALWRQLGSCEPCQAGH